MHKTTIKRIAFAIAIIAVSAMVFTILAETMRQGKIVESTRSLMSTVITIKIPTSRSISVEAAEEAATKAFNEIERIENDFSVYKPDSQVFRVNCLRPHEKFIISAELFSVIEKSIEISSRTEGAFDITVKPLIDLWKEAKIRKLLPTGDEISLALSKTGYRSIILDKTDSSIVFDKDGMSIDLGGIAKGYACDKAIKVLRESGISNAVVACGGDLYCLGGRTKAEPWNVGVRHPRDATRMAFLIKLRDRSIDTSGDYERFFILDGKRYSHIIDPRTGYPVGDRTISATVIAHESMISDALATALLILGKEYINLITKIEGTDAIVVYNENGSFKTVLSNGIEGRYVITQEKL